MVSQCSALKKTDQSTMTQAGGGKLRVMRLSSNHVARWSILTNQVPDRTAVSNQSGLSASSREKRRGADIISLSASLDYPHEGKETRREKK